MTPIVITEAYPGTAPDPPASLLTTIQQPSTKVTAVSALPAYMATSRGREEKLVTPVAARRAFRSTSPGR